jgi:4-hydroxyphenylacetate 3-monooxygenase
LIFIKVKAKFPKGITLGGVIMGPRNGEEYLSSLNDGREIWIDGRRIDDVTTEPCFRQTARAIAQYYDFQHQPELWEIMTYATPDGGRANISYIEPRSKDDLRRRGAAFAMWANATCGLMGRAPDYMNSLTMALGAARNFLGRSDRRLGENAYNYYLRCRRNDICLTHTFTAPMIDRQKRLGEQEAYRTAGVVRETTDGVVIRGAKVVGTLAPFCNENLSLGPFMSLQDDEKKYAISFAHPVNAPGVRWICRDSLLADANFFDHPIASRFDEMDCVCVLDDVLIPWEQVFVYQDTSIHNAVPRQIRMWEAFGHQVLIKNVAKTRFLFGLTHLIAETTQVSGFINVQEKLGEILTYLWNLESLTIAAVEGAFEADNGLWYCNSNAIRAGLGLYPEYYTRIISILQKLGASGFVATPQEKTLDVLGAAIERYFEGANKDARGRVQLFRLGWELAGETWGGRHSLYEQNFIGSSERVRSLFYQYYDKDEAINMVQRILQQPSEDRVFHVTPVNMSS